MSDLIIWAISQRSVGAKVTIWNPQQYSDIPFWKRGSAIAHGNMDGKNHVGCTKYAGGGAVDWSSAL